jgi:ATP-dependent exoDNAse (exonuclease V) beta subunit
MNESPQVLIVEASAGSGKTYCLAKHYLKLLLNKDSYPKQIENILAITFTNKATRQMKERILEFLKEIALDEFSDSGREKDILSGIALSKKEAQAKAIQLMDYIIANYNFFQVKTIDSFVNMLLLGCAYQLGLSANFEIREDRDDYLNLSLDTCIEQANHDKSVQKIFKDFLTQYIYLEGKNSWFPKKDILDLLSAMFYHANIYGGSFRKFDLAGLNLYQEKQGLIELFQKLLKNAPPGLNGTFRNSLVKFLEDNEEIFDFGDIAGRKGFLKDELPMNKEELVPLEVKKLWAQIRSKTVELSEKEARAYFNCYIDIFELVYRAFRSYAKKDDVLFLEELNQQAHSLIRQNGLTVPELYYHIATRLKAFLIDEFQDTSGLQWRNLFAMVEEAISTGGTLFYVGDKKQAIFRFRGGEVALFEVIKKEFSRYVKPDSIKVNYRSVKEIVEFNNNIFSQENLLRFLNDQQDEAALNNELKYFSREDMDEILAVFSAPEQECARAEHGLVKVESVDCLSQQERDELTKLKVLTLIDEITGSGRFNKKDITILCRGNKEVELASTWLIEKNIPVESEKTLNIRNNKFIKELLCLLRFLNSPIDNLSFAAFILGDIFLKASQLKRQEIEEFLFGLKGKLAEQGFYIYREFRRKYQDIWRQLLEEFFQEVGYLGLYELLIDILSRFKALVNFPNQQGFFMHFLQIIKDSEDEYPGISDFLEHFEEIDVARLFVNSSGADAVKVMTIHKAKGLGFEVVIVPFLYLDINDLGSQTKRGRVSYVVEEGSQGLSLLRLDRKYAQLSPEIRRAFQEEYKKEFIDELNTIYVALTRPKSELYVFIPHGIRMINNVARFLIPQGYAGSAEPPAHKKEAKEDISTLPIPAPRYWKWSDFLKEEFGDARTLKKREALLAGEVLHEVLAAIGNLARMDKEEALQQGLSRVKDLFPGVSDFSSSEAVIRKALDAENLKQFFYVSGAAVYREKEVVDSLGITKRIDRLIIKEKEAWVVDYKTREELVPDYSKQVEAYKAIIKDLYPKHIVRGFLVYLEDLKVEEVDA